MRLAHRDLTTVTTDYCDHYSNSYGRYFVVSGKILGGPGPRTQVLVMQNVGWEDLLKANCHGH